MRRRRVPNLTKSDQANCACEAWAEISWREKRIKQFAMQAPLSLSWDSSRRGRWATPSARSRDVANGAVDVQTG